MKPISAPENLRRESVLGEYEHEFMLYNERGELVHLTYLLESFYHLKIMELVQKSGKNSILNAVSHKEDLP
jgi:hypothetical protein